MPLHPQRNQSATGSVVFLRSVFSLLQEKKPFLLLFQYVNERLRIGQLDNLQFNN